MNKLLAGLIFAILGLASPAMAQTKFTMPPPAGVSVVGVQVVSTCGAASGLANNNIAYLAMNTAGQLCTNASGGGGSSYTVTYGGAIGTLGTPDGYKDASGNFQPFLGDTTSGQWVNVKASVLPTGVSTAANQSTEITSLGTIATNSALPLPAQSTHTVNIGAVDSISQYPGGATPITASATGTTAATTATLAGTSGKTTYVCGYSIRANATANTNVTNTLTGVISGTMSSIMWVPANTAGLGVDEQIFSPCIPASAANTAINAVSGAPGTGGLVSSKIWGYQL